MSDGTLDSTVNQDPSLTPPLAPERDLSPNPPEEKKILSPLDAAYALRDEVELLHKDTCELISLQVTKTRALVDSAEKAVDEKIVVLKSLIAGKVKAISL